MMPNYEVLDDICCAADDTDCALISTLVSGVLYHYDLMSGDLSEEERLELFITMIRLFSKDMFYEAVCVLYLAFSLMGYMVASEVVSAVGACGDDHCMMVFLAKFLLACPDELNAIYDRR